MHRNNTAKICYNNIIMFHKLWINKDATTLMCTDKSQENTFLVNLKIYRNSFYMACYRVFAQTLQLYYMHIT
jgi:hypothetical protein